MPFESADKMPEGLDVLFLPGLVGKFDGPLETGETVYPSSATDVEKVLRGAGLKVGYAVEPRASVGLKAAEWWAPILVFTVDALKAGAADLVVAYLRELFPPAELRKMPLHIKAGCERPDGLREWYEGDGPGEQVLEGFVAWQDRERAR